MFESFLEKSQNRPLAKKSRKTKQKNTRKDRKRERTRQKNKREDRKGESNDSPEIPNRGDMSDIPSLLLGAGWKTKLYSITNGNSKTHLSLSLFLPTAVCDHC